jgi:hypothetical protein
MSPHDLPSDERTRRELLRAGAGAVSTGFITLTAGCSSALPPLGSELRFGQVRPPAAAAPTYRRWLPAPSELDDFDQPHYRVLLRQPTEVAYPAPVRFTTPRKRLLAGLDYFGVGYANYDRLLWTPFGVVLEGGFDPATVTTTFTESGYRRTETHADHDVFVRSDGERRAVLTDDALVWSSERVHDRPNVEALVDTHDGHVARYHDENDAFGRVTDAVGESRMVEFIPPNDERTWASCEAFRFDDDTAYHVRTFLYPLGQTPAERELRRRSKTGTVLTREVENTDFHVDGRQVTVKGRIPPGAGIQPSEIHPPYPPQITWGFDRDREAESIRLRHEAGEPVDSDALWLSFEADDTGEELTMPTTQSLPTEHDEMAPGDAVTIDVSTVPEVSVRRPTDTEPSNDETDATRETPHEPRPATRIDLDFGVESAGRTLFSVPLEADDDDFE